MEKIILFGIGSLAKRVKKFMDLEGDYRVEAFTVNRKYIGNNMLYGLPVVPFEDIEKIYLPAKYDVIICVGYSNMNNNYINIYNEVLKKGYKLTNYISKKAMVYSENYGVGNIIFPNVFIDLDVQIGNGNRFEISSSISHNTVIGDYNFFAPRSAISGDNRIHNNCFFGIGSAVKNNIDIADYTLVGAGTYIRSSTEMYSVYTNNTIKLDKKSIDIVL